MEAEVRATLRKLGLRARKGLGQNFLVDREVLADILNGANLGSGDTVVEVGPGLGVLTEALAPKVARVVAVELDERLAEALKQKMARFPNVVVVQGSILDIAPESLLKDERLTGGYKVVANIPYYITAPILRHFLEQAQVKPRLMVLMVQKEVAEVITAAPGEMSLLSVSVRFYARPSIVRYVPAASFFPPPKVDSAVVKIEVLDRPALTVDDPKEFFKVVAAGFKGRRKQLHNALFRGLNLERDETLACLARAGIAETRRAQTLSLEEWGRLYEAFKEGGDLSA